MKLLKLVPDNTNIDFMRWRNLALVLSIIATVASLALVGDSRAQPRRRFRWRPDDPRDLRPADRGRPAARHGSAGSALGEAQHPGIRRPDQLPDPPAEAGGRRGRGQSRGERRSGRCSASRYPGARVDSVETVSGKVSEELATDGALAIAFAMLGIAIYIWLRFEWQFGVGALVTLFHDVSMTLGFFSLTQLQVDLNVVAAILDHRRLFAQRYGRDL